MARNLENIEVDSNFNVVSYSFATSPRQKRNPYIPEFMMCDTKTKITVVTWPDGQTTQVTCDKKDVFTVEFAYYVALVIYANGNHK